MKTTVRFITYCFLIIAAFLAISCEMGLALNSSSDSIYSQSEIIDSADFVEETEVLFMMYLDGDNNLNNAAWENFKQVQKGLMNLPNGASVTVAALIDGISKDTSARLYPGLSHIGDIYGRSFLLRIGAYTQEEFEQDNLVAASTLDY